jgi:hypothetical protein
MFVFAPDSSRKRRFFGSTNRLAIAKFHRFSMISARRCSRAIGLLLQRHAGLPQPSAARRLGDVDAEVRADRVEPDAGVSPDQVEHLLGVGRRELDRTLGAGLVLLQRAALTNTTYELVQTTLAHLEPTGDARDLLAPLHRREHPLPHLDRAPHGQASLPRHHHPRPNSIAQGALRVS